MRRYILLLVAALSVSALRATQVKPDADTWPDGTAIDAWFHDTTAVDIPSLGKQYVLTDYGIHAGDSVCTAAIQALIDRIAGEGGGVLVIPAGTFITGELHFRQGVHLHLQKGAVLLGSDDIADYPIGKTRIEGETCTYFGALINADSLNGFTITGEGTIDGNGLRYYRAFWLRRQWNPQCTNKDEQRPRLIYLSNCCHVRIEGVRLQNAAFWTTHIYHSHHVRLQHLTIYSPAEPQDSKGPSTDAIDLDAVSDILVRRCYMEVNDDAIAMKGGKGPWADNPARSEGNGPNTNVLIQDCVFGFCHGCLTLGSESVFNHNILMRRIQVNKAARVLWLKMRPDTPQRYEYVTVEHITGEADFFLYIHPWTQFYDLKDRTDIPKSYADHITLQHCTMTVSRPFDVVEQPDQYELTNFIYNDLNLTSPHPLTFPLTSHHTAHLP